MSSERASLRRRKPPCSAGADGTVLLETRFQAVRSFLHLKSPALVLQSIKRQVRAASRLHGGMDVPRDGARGWARGPARAPTARRYTRGLHPFRSVLQECAVRAVSHQDAVRFSLWAPTARLNRFEVICGDEHPSGSGALLNRGTRNQTISLSSPKEGRKNVAAYGEPLLSKDREALMPCMG